MPVQEHLRCSISVIAPPRNERTKEAVRGNDCGEKRSGESLRKLRTYLHVNAVARLRINVHRLCASGKSGERNSKHQRRSRRIKKGSSRCAKLIARSIKSRINPYNFYWKHLLDLSIEFRYRYDHRVTIEILYILILLCQSIIFPSLYNT